MQLQPAIDDADLKIYQGDVRVVLPQLPANSVDCAITSPPFWNLRDYGVDGQIGLEHTPEMWAQELVRVCEALAPVLRPHATLWVEVGDCYLDKNLVGAPWLFAFAMKKAGWVLRQCIIWHKPNAMPESSRDRTTMAHSYIFLFAKRNSYYFDPVAIQEPVEWARWGDQTTPKYNGTKTGTGWMRGKLKEELPKNPTKNPRSVWSIPTGGFSARELGGGATRITSPDCPVHGDRSVPVPRAQRDVRGDAPPPHTQHTDASPSAAQLDDSAPTDQRHALDSAHGIQDSLLPDSSASATLHSNESHKMDLAPETSQPCTPCGETPHHTDDTSTSPENAPAIHPDNDESKTSEGSSSREKDSTYARTSRRTSGKCTCETKMIDHFATFPEALVERMLKASCPPEVCVTCHTPRERIMSESEGQAYDGEASSTGRPDGAERRNPRGGQREWDAYVPAQHVGWTDCGCAQGWTPGTCLDPFMGSGTTAVVARRLGLHSVGIELNPEYVELCRKRTEQLSLLA